MNMKYTDDHEWARPDGDLLVVGITDFAQQQLGEVVFVELPEVDREVDQGEDTAVVESVKAAGEVKSPVSGTIVEVNETLADTPEKVNEDPTGEGWFYKLRPSDPGQLEALLDQEAYQTLVESLA
ncbi:MAG: glycine cleavage system protein GcvH [Arenicellales bacterium]